MSWKVPIDTEHDSFFGSDYLCCDLFRLLLLRSQRNDMGKPEYYEGKPYQLKRGQSLYGRLGTAKRLRASPSGTDRALLRLEKVYSKVTSERTRNYTIVTIKNYDQEIELDKHLNKQRTSKDTQVDTNKEGKKEENNSKELESTALQVREALQKIEKGDPEVNEGMGLLRELLGSRPTQEKRNRYALYRLYQKRTRERVLKAIRYAFSVRDMSFAPVISNYLDLEQKWDALETHARRKNFGGIGAVMPKESEVAIYGLENNNERSK